MISHQGRCRCGGVSASIRGDASFTGYCHCDDCRRSNGAPVTAFAGFQREQLEWKSQDTLKEWRNGEFARLFCKSCGAPVAYTDAALPQTVFFYVGFMEDPEAFPPKDHSYHSEKISWLQLSDTLEKHDKTSYPRPTEFSMNSESIS